MKLDQGSLTTPKTFLAELENDRSENEKTLKDSSKNYFVFPPGKTPNDFESYVTKKYLNKFSSISTQGMIPEYLIVFNEINNK